MARNPNTALANKNTLYLACSGGGKSQAIKQNTDIPKKAARVVLWDIDHDHKAVHVESMAGFIRAVKAGIRSRRGFRIAYSGDDTPENFEVFCSVVWAIADGKIPLYIIIEELADAAPSTGKASPNFGRVLRKIRKFNGRLHITSQRGTEIPKTAYTQCPNKYIGIQEGADVERMAKLAGIEARKIRELTNLEFYVKQAGAGEPEKIKLKFKK